MKAVDVSDLNYKRLFDLAESFDDDANSVIGKLLDQAEGNDFPGRNPAHRATGSILPLGEYWVPILEIVAEAGGAAPAKDVIAALHERLGDKLGEVDEQRVRSGEQRWKNRARFARLRMKERGLLSSPSRGIWAITDAGHRYLDDPGAVR